VLFIAAEGTSWMNRFVRPLKSGAARIAFGAEARNDWQLDVKIIPIGLSYSAPNLFRSEVVVNIGAPVYPRDWAEIWQKKHARGVQELTDHVENQLKILSIHTRDEAGEQLITRLEEILQNEKPLPQKAAFERSQQLVQTALDDEKLETSTNAYFEKLQQNRWTDALIQASNPTAHKQALGWWLLLGFPIFSIGYTIWFLPCFLPWYVNKKMGLYIGYSTTVKMLVGLFSFPPVIWVVYKLGVYLTGLPILGWLAVALAAALGIFVEFYQDLFKKFMTRRWAKRLAAKHPESLAELQQKRAAVLAKLNSSSGI
jgi:glycerol-3-phosphate O-acyltransferase/dihydroxyacetone phosphate acyltransferase